MWELYAFWTLVPLLLPDRLESVAVRAGGAFAVMAAGVLGCILGGHFSRRWGSARVAAFALTGSGLCCVAFVGLALADAPAVVQMLVLLFWGATVVADSPQFSALCAQTCPRDAVGSALALQNALGFTLTLVAIAWVSFQFEQLGVVALLWLVPGPAAGLWASRALWRSKP